MTLKLFKRMLKIDSVDKSELLSLLEDAKDDGTINMLQYAQIKSDINKQYREEQPRNNRPNRITYTDEEVLTVLKSHLEVYDGIKDLSAHLNLMKQLFGEESSQFRNGSQYNRNFYKTLDEGQPNLGQSLPANWADGILTLIQDRPVQFNNTLDACKKIYDATNNGNMMQVIQKWRGRV